MPNVFTDTSPKIREKKKKKEEGQGRWECNYRSSALKRSGPER
jgi:hypothetical protein